MDFTNLLISTILHGWSALAQGVLLGIGLVLLVKTALALLTPANASTRFAIWFVTLISVAMLPPVLFVRAAIAEMRAVAPKPVPPANVLSAIPASPTAVQAASAAPLAPVEPAAAISPAPVRREPWRMMFQVDVEAIAVILLFYAGIVSLLLLRLLLSYHRLCRLKNTACPAPPELVQRFEGWLRLCGTNRPVRLLISSKAKSPMAAGFSRPAVILPDSLLLRLTGAELDHIGLHELAHIRRQDDWTNLTQKFLQAIFFFHPAIHWIARKLDFEREVACDDWVLTMTGEAKPYARSLTKVLEVSPWRSGPILASGAVFRKRHIIRRIEMLLDGSRDSRPKISQVTFVVILMCLFGAFTQIVQMPEFLAFGADRGSHRWRWQTDDRSLEVQMRGDISFGDDDASIKHLGPDAYFSAAERRGWTSRKVEIRPGPEAKPEMKYFVDSRERPVDAMAKEWIAGIIPAVLRESGINAEERVARILEKRGVAGVFDEIDRISSDHSRRLYLSSVIQAGKLNQDELRRAMDRVRKISGDHEKASLLNEVAPAYDSAELRPVYFDGVNSISSDHDRRNVLTKILTESQMDSAVMMLVGRSIEKISSDHDKSEVLKLTAQQIGSIDPEARRALLRAADSISSDHDKGNVVSKLLGAGNLAPDTLVSLLRVAQNISSDHDKTRTLEVALKEDLRVPAVQKAFFAAVNTISSDNDRSRLLHAAAERANLDTALLDQAAKSAGKMSSDHDKANVLSKLAASEPTPEFINAVKSIQSDSDKRRVLEAMLKQPVSRQLTLEAITLASTISSDNDKADVLKQIAEKQGEDPEVRDAVRRAAESIQSDSDYRRVVSKLFAQEASARRDPSGAK